MPAVTRPAPRCSGTPWLGGCGRGPPSTCIAPLAQLVGLSEAELRRLVRISFAKVAEYQKRGAIHFHAIIRLDAAINCGCPACVALPPGSFTTDLLEQATRQAAAIVSVPCPPLDNDQRVTLVARWGEQLDVRRISCQNDDERS